MTTPNPVNLDTAGYLGTSELITKVTEVADENSGCAADSTPEKGGLVTTPVDYGNLEITLILEGKLYIVYIIALALATAMKKGAMSCEGGCSVDAVLITSDPSGAKKFVETIGESPT